MASNQERTEKSRKALLEAARSLFGDKGYAETSTAMVCQQAGVSRGALYHHFKDKEALFHVVVRAEYCRVEDLINQASTRPTDPLERLIEGGDGFIDAMSEPVSRQILLVDGPSILGSETIRTIDHNTTTKILHDGIVAAQKAGRLPDIPATALTSMMSGAYDRAVLDGLWDSEEARLAVRHAIRAVWNGLARMT